MTWTAPNCCSDTIGLCDETNPVPDIDGLQFVTAASASYSKRLLQTFKLADSLNTEQLIQEHLIPAWKNEQAHTWSPSCKEQIARFILGRFSLLSLDSQKELRGIRMIPVSQLNGTKTSSFANADSLIDPSVSELRSLCFDDEEIIPESDIFSDFSAALIGCGLKTAVDGDVVVHRIRCYADTKHSLQDIQKRAQNLLKSSCRWTSQLSNRAASDLQCLKWLPVVDTGGTLMLKPPRECRGFRDRLLVGSQLSILDIPISTEWEERLGWHEPLPGEILLSQLENGVQARDRSIVEAVLSYISQHGLEEMLLESLVGIPCVLTSHGSFVIASQTFRPPASSITSCDGLHPYLANADRKFWRDHADLLVKLGVRDQLQPDDLLKVQEGLEAKAVLEGPDVGVAIEIAKLASQFPRTKLAKLKVISDTKELYLIQDISYDDLWPLKSKETVILTHPQIPRTTIQSLGIGSLRERLVKGMLEIEDVDDEDEFDQREKVTTRIADTLDRYSIEATFREYLANAEDTEGVSRISWLLDEREHSTQKLLTAEMGVLQGPALLVHNDGGKLFLRFEI